MTMMLVMMGMVDAVVAECSCVHQAGMVVATHKGTASQTIGIASGATMDVAVMSGDVVTGALESCAAFGATPSAVLVEITSPVVGNLHRFGGHLGNDVLEDDEIKTKSTKNSSLTSSGLSTVVCRIGALERRDGGLVGWCTEDESCSATMLLCSE